MKEYRNAIAGSAAIALVALLAVAIAANWQRIKVQYYFYMLKRGDAVYRDLILSEKDFPVAKSALFRLEDNSGQPGHFDDRLMEIIFLRGNGEEISKAGELFSEKTALTEGGLKAKAWLDNYYGVLDENAGINITITNVSNKPIELKTSGYQFKYNYIFSKYLLESPSDNAFLPPSKISPDAKKECMSAGQNLSAGDEVSLRMNFGKCLFLDNFRKPKVLRLDISTMFSKDKKAKEFIKKEFHIYCKIYGTDKR